MNDPHQLPESIDPQAEDDSQATLTPNYDTVPGDVSPNAPSTIDLKQPERLGRYRIERTLGEGGFGRVYQAYDEELKRQVAIKVPQPERISHPKEVEQYLAEAQVLASLDHPGIVPVYDVGRTDDGLCYVVSKIIEGSDLAKRIKKERLTVGESAELVATVAEALHYAHSKGLVHRDVKPANILIDSAGKPYVADFGLALKEEDIGSGSGWAGTPNYMSPEQARGEGHRVDGRSDIFSVGVVFYEMLTGKRPFQGNTSQKLLEQITSVDARPLRQRDDSIPKELERICLKALSKKASDRYTAAKDMADDLRHFLSESPQDISVAPATSANSHVASGADTRIASDSSNTTGASDSQPIKVVPKGLRSFDEHDADFFLELLPGPRDRDGLPDGIRFWKTRIEETDADKTFAVGLIYGPSGCGKSSMVKAGLLPRLSDNVIPIYVEATLDETESRLLHGLRKRLSGLPDGLSLKDTLTALRRGHGVPGDKKVLIVLDQFEQWLHAHREAEDTELVAALRQCDGSRVQVIVMVRDDFWLAVSRFMKDLEVRLVEAENSALVDLFDADHARRVLTAFGRAFGRLPETFATRSSDQNEFLKQSVTGLADEGKVICVRLALFADMMKGKPWTPATLKAIGGTTGVGVMFLEETFSTSTAPPEHRYHQKAARNVLRALLPESGTDIKGHMRSSDDLLEASGYARRPGDFQDLIRILDSEIRLVTPTDPAGDWADDNQETPDANSGQTYYQLTHDYLVPSLRDWLTRKQRETLKGRAALRLAERSALWNAKPENRHLPAWWEYLSVVGLTRMKSWTQAQRKMMRQAGRFHGVRAAVAVAVVALVAFGGISLRQGILEGQRQAQQESISKERSARAEELVSSLQNADIGKVREIVDQLESFQDLTEPLLRKQLAAAADGSSQKLNLSLGLLASDPNQVEYLYDQLLLAEAEAFPVIRDFLADHQDQLVPQLWDLLDNPQRDAADKQLHAAAALATYDPANPKWTTVRERAAAELVAVPVSFLGNWKEAFRPIAKDLLEPLTDIYRDEEQDELARSLATSLLADYARQDVEQLASLVSVADEKQFAVLYPVLSKQSAAAVKELQSILQRKTEPTWNDEAFDPAWQPIDPSMKNAIESAEGILADRFAFCQTMPLLQCIEAIESLRQSGYRPIRFRPYAINDGVQVAAVWTRDSRAWQMVHDLSAVQMQTKDQELRQQGLVPVDISGYLARDEASLPASRYAAIWVDSAEEENEVRLYAGVPTHIEQTLLAQPWEEAGFNRLTFHAFLGQDGVEVRSAIWSKRKGQEQSTSQVFAGIESHFTGEIYPGLLLTELNVSRNAEPQDSQQRSAEQLKIGEPLLADRADDANLRKFIATARFQLKQDEQALEDLNWLIEKLPNDSSLYQFRAIVLARAKRADEAKQDLASFANLNNNGGQLEYLDAIISAHLGEDAEGMQRLEAAISQAPSDLNVLYNGACAYSLASGVFAAEEVSKSKVYADRAIALLRDAIASGNDNYEHMQQDADLDPLRSHPGFAELMGAGTLDRRCVAVWNVSTAFESTELHGLAPDEQRQRCRELVTAGYRPAVMSVSMTKDSSSLVTTSVWHRPQVPDAAKESLAKQQANVAVALFRMDQCDAVWPLLKHSPDPRTRSYLIHRLSPLGSDPQAIIERLEVEPEVSIRRALILTLGEFNDRQLPPTEQERLAVKLLDTYAADPDAGIHAASEWVLRQWEQGALLKEKDREFATGKLEGNRQWYVNKQGQTLVVIPGPVEFVMGSPVGEAGRESGPEGPWESQHRKRINRTFAIMTHEVTVDQFREFQNDYSYSKTYSRGGDDPVNTVTWYAAAEYCNWLSKQEDLPDDEWCYLPNGDKKYAEGMKPAPDYLERSGYRLPTESEWEYACRSGALTSRYFGETEDLIDQHAWYAKNSLNRWMLPVGSLQPNDQGLFDMQGNAAEWCHEVTKYYGVSSTRGWSEDLPDLSEARDGQLRVLRGGSFYSRPQTVRSANRFRYSPALRIDLIGMRAARTYP